MEDHGYIIDFGISGKTGFLLKKNVAEFVKSTTGGKVLCSGQVLQCVVLSATDAKAVSVGVNPSQVNTAVMSRDLLVRLGSLLPGNLVKATIKQVIEMVDADNFLICFSQFYFFFFFFFSFLVGCFWRGVNF